MAPVAVTLAAPRPDWLMVPLRLLRVPAEMLMLFADSAALLWLKVVADRLAAPVLTMVPPSPLRVVALTASVPLPACSILPPLLLLRVDAESVRFWLLVAMRPALLLSVPVGDARAMVVLPVPVCTISPPALEMSWAVMLSWLADTTAPS